MRNTTGIIYVVSTLLATQRTQSTEINNSVKYCCGGASSYELPAVIATTVVNV